MFTFFSRRNFHQSSGQDRPRLAGLLLVTGGGKDERVRRIQNNSRLYSFKRKMTGACQGRHLLCYNATLLTAEARMMLRFVFTPGPRAGRGPHSPVLSDTEPQAAKRLETSGFLIETLETFCYFHRGVTEPIVE